MPSERETWSPANEPWIPNAWESRSLRSVSSSRAISCLTSTLVWIASECLASASSDASFISALRADIRTLSSACNSGMVCPLRASTSCINSLFMLASCLAACFSVQFKFTRSSAVSSALAVRRLRASAESSSERARQRVALSSISAARCCNCKLCLDSTDLTCACNDCSRAVCAWWSSLWSLHNCRACSADSACCSTCNSPKSLWH
mmetsp:Transcript_139208/g.347017  ORF Transcript_139208/g.347017 Transcript_139208/m.347017 type:complete len:206 (+) Transcript_139208:747-1364(+)